MTALVGSRVIESVQRARIRRHLHVASMGMSATAAVLKGTNADRNVQIVAALSSRSVQMVFESVTSASNWYAVAAGLVPSVSTIARVRCAAMMNASGVFPRVSPACCQDNSVMMRVRLGSDATPGVMPVNPFRHHHLDGVNAVRSMRCASIIVPSEPSVMRRAPNVR